MRLRPKLLTLTICAAAVLLTVRVGGLWIPVPADVAQAQALEANEPAAGDAAPTDGDAPAPEAEQRDSPSTDGGTPDAAARPAPSPIAPADPSVLTDAEIELLQKLSQRRRRLDAREKDLDLREGVLKAAEKRVEDKIGELSKLQKVVAKLITQHDEEEAKKIDSLVKIYQSMKPKDAARIFGQLDLPILVQVVQRMKEAKVAPILAAMDPKRAIEITARLAERREDVDMPEDDGS